MVEGTGAAAAVREGAVVSGSGRPGREGLCPRGAPEVWDEGAGAVCPSEEHGGGEGGAGVFCAEQVIRMRSGGPVHRRSEPCASSVFVCTVSRNLPVTLSPACPGLTAEESGAQVR